MLAFVVLIAAAASSIVKPEPTWRPPAPLRGDGHVVAREGLRFRLPPGLSYSASDERGEPVWTARSADGTTVVAVKAFRSDATVPCRTAPEGIRFDAFTTAHGFRGCIGTAYADDSPLALTQAFVKGGDVVVSVFAIAAEEAVEALARGVADSVEIEADAATQSTLPRHDVPRPDSRLVGCFERLQSFTPALGRRSTRCFEPDSTLIETRVDSAFGQLLKPTRKAGTWVYADGYLYTDVDDDPPEEARVAFDGDDLRIGGDVWRRLEPEDD